MRFIKFNEYVDEGNICMEGVYLLTNVKHLMNNIGEISELCINNTEDFILYESKDFDKLMVDLL